MVMDGKVGIVQSILGRSYMSGLGGKGIVLLSLASGYVHGMWSLERACLPGLAPGSFLPQAWTFLSVSSFLSSTPHPSGHGLPGEPVCRSGAGYKAPGAGHAELPAEKP